jgi:hypothetical protein
MNHDEVDILLKELAERELAATPKGYNEEEGRYGVCPPIWRYKQAAANNTWTSSERSHIRGCPYCQKTIAMQWSLACPESETLENTSFSQAAGMHANACARCKAVLKGVAGAAKVYPLPSWALPARDVLGGGDVVAGGQAAGMIPTLLVRADGRTEEVAVEILPPERLGSFRPLVENFFYLSLNNRLVVTLRIRDQSFPVGIAEVRVCAVTGDGTEIPPFDSPATLRRDEECAFEFPLSESDLREWCGKPKFLLKAAALGVLLGGGEDGGRAELALISAAGREWF